ncbi:MAG: UDP-N-acetylmuramoylalanyl-D-glutamyl-2, 6-diaminopimelate--D-alanyl-D-alanine ligase, partial [Rhodobiaceae bacterium]|nr:UDP-N-acetylmuramoylalanyl-D-glutamyl-2, 6-diaminopimelate--D-alanyl-D-alanine ligase [Rhodobiaceae bacterium]
MARVMAAQVVGAAPEGVTGISIDSRTIEPGEAYFAIKGDTHDGHAFVAPALKAGAGVAVVAVSKVPTLGVSQGCLLIVPDVL